MAKKGQKQDTSASQNSNRESTPPPKMPAIVKRILVGTGSLAGLVAIAGLIISMLQLSQSTVAGVSSDAAQATVVSILDKQLAVQKEIATAQAKASQGGPAATTAAEQVLKLIKTQEALAAAPAQVRQTPDALSNCPSKIEFGQTVQCSIESAHESDSYTFEGMVDDRILIRMTRTSDTLQPRVQVFDPNNAKVCESFGERLVDMLECTLPRTGKYTIQSSDASSSGKETGQYTLYLQRINKPGQTIPIVFGQNLTGSIWQTAKIETYTFVAKVDDTVLIRAVRTSETFQPWIRVYDPKGALACEGYDERFVEMNRCIIPRSGLYTIIVADSSRNRTEVGDYTVYIQRLNNPGIAIPIMDKQPVDASISQTAEVDTFVFEGKVDEKILFQINRASETVNPWIRVFAADGKMICEAYHERQAETVCTLPRSGKYTIILSDGSRARNEVGEYTISMVYQ